MRLSASNTTADVTAALTAFVASLRPAWFTVGVFTDDRMHRRLASHRCPRAFAGFAARLGLGRRPDGAYPGTFADSTLMLVKIGDAAHEDCLVCAVGLDKGSPLNDGVVLGCVGSVIQEALARVQRCRSETRRLAMLEASIDADVILLFDASGKVVERYPERPAVDVSFAVVQAAFDRRFPNGPGRHVVLSIGKREYSLRARWITTDRLLRERMLLVHAHQRSAPATLGVADRLKSYGLSKREAQIAELVFSGATNQLIARTLFISADTVKTHCRHIFSKLGISRRTEFLKVVSTVRDRNAPHIA